MAGADLEIRSFRTVFALERRVYQIDTFRLNPSGVPLRGIVYALCLATACLIAGALPVLSWPLESVPWYLRDVAFPIAAAGLLTVTRIEGRPFHIAAVALLRQRLCSRRFVGLQPAPLGGARVWRPPPIVWIVDGSEAEPRALRYHGPGAVLVCFAHDRAEWRGGLALGRRAHLSVHPLPGARAARPRALELAAGAVLAVSPRPLRRRGS